MDDKHVKKLLYYLNLQVYSYSCISSLSGNTAYLVAENILSFSIFLHRNPKSNQNQSGVLLSLQPFLCVSPALTSPHLGYADCSLVFLPLDSVHTTPESAF